MSSTDPLEQAIQAVRSGEIARARTLLTQILNADPQQAQAWFWLAACWIEPEKQRFCLEKAAALRPDDQQIHQALDRFTAQHGLLSDQASQGSDLVSFSTPFLSQEDLAGPDLVPSTSSELGEPLSTPAPESPAEPADDSHAAQAPAASQSPPAGKTARKTKAPSSRRKTRSRPAQLGLLILLSLLALISMAVLVLVIKQTGLPGFLFGQLPANAPAEMPIFQMEPTWTPTPRLEPSPTLVRPTSTPLPTAAPVASLTPYLGDWRLEIGRSIQDRPIEVYRFGTGSHERLIVAGIHGGSESITIALADQMIDHLKENPKLVPATVSLYILRSLNPDGEALYDKTGARFNANGIDLNRNFAANWKTTWAAQGCNPADTNTAGPKPASEPETQAFVKFLSTRKIEALINYHSGGKGIFPAGQPAEPGSVRLAQSIAAVSEYPYPPPATGCEYTGTLVDWAASQGVPAAVDLELASKTEMDLAVNLRILELLLNWEP